MKKLLIAVCVMAFAGTIFGAILDGANTERLSAQLATINANIADLQSSTSSINAAVIALRADFDGSSNGWTLVTDWQSSNSTLQASIDAFSDTDTNAVWGNITGTLSDQTDLNTELAQFDGSSNDFRNVFDWFQGSSNSFASLTANQTWTGNNTFTGGTFIAASGAYFDFNQNFFLGESGGEMFASVSDRPMVLEVLRDTFYIRTGTGEPSTNRVVVTDSGVLFTNGTVTVGDRLQINGGTSVNGTNGLSATHAGGTYNAGLLTAVETSGKTNCIGMHLENGAAPPAESVDQNWAVLVYDMATDNDMLTGTCKPFNEDTNAQAFFRYAYRIEDATGEGSNIVWQLSIRHTSEGVFTTNAADEVVTVTNALTAVDQFKVFKVDFEIDETLGGFGDLMAITITRPGSSDAGDTLNRDVGGLHDLWYIYTEK